MPMSSPPNPSTVPLAFDDVGQGPPILLLHGIFVSRRQWKAQLAALSTSHRVIACDLRGHGDTGSSPGPYSVAQLARDVVALLDRLGIESVLCCGHSFGGFVAQELAISHPRRIKKLILVETLFGVSSTFWEAAMVATQAAVMSALQPQWILSTSAAYFGALCSNGSASIVREVGPHLQDQANAYKILGASVHFNSRWRLHRIACPTLIVIGQVPHIPLVMVQGWEMWWRIGQARLAVAPNCGHMVHWDNPSWFNRTLTAFASAPIGNQQIARSEELEVDSPPEATP